MKKKYNLLFVKIKSANMFKMDTMRNWNARPRDTAASDSGTLQAFIFYNLTISRKNGALEISLNEIFLKEEL